MRNDFAAHTHGTRDEPKARKQLADLRRVAASLASPFLDAELHRRRICRPHRSRVRQRPSSSTSTPNSPNPKSLFPSPSQERGFYLIQFITNINMIMIATESHSPLVLEILSLVNWTGWSVAELTYAGRLGTGRNALTLKAAELISEVRPLHSLQHQHLKIRPSRFVRSRRLWRRSQTLLQMSFSVFLLKRLSLVARRALDQIHQTYPNIITNINMKTLSIEAASPDPKPPRMGRKYRPAYLEEDGPYLRALRCREDSLSPEAREAWFNWTGDEVTAALNVESVVLTDGEIEVRERAGRYYFYVAGEQHEHDISSDPSITNQGEAESPLRV